MLKLEPSLAVAAPLAAVDETMTIKRRVKRLLHTMAKLRLGVISGILLVLLAIVAIAAPIISPYDPVAGSILTRMEPPFWMEGSSAAHLLGTDGVGRDELSRLIYGARVTLLVATVSTMVSITIGLLLGMAAGYLGKVADWIISTAVNIMLTFPFVLMALAVIAVMGSSLANVIFVMAITGWPGYTRVARVETMRLKEMEHIQAARVIGASGWRIVFRHIMPNLINGLLVLSSVQLGRVIIAEAFLGFLGLGVKPPTPSWGNMLGESRTFMFEQWWMAAFPGFMILITSLAVNLVGDSLRDYLDPHTRNL